MKYIWIGHRESEIYKTENFFDFSITSFGSNTENNISYCKKFSTREINEKKKKEFIVEILKKITIEKQCKIMFYSSTLAYSLMKICPEFEENFICLNKANTLSLLNNKIKTRLWLSSYLPVLKFILLSGEDCNYYNLCNCFPEDKNFVIQEENSSGGLGTYFVNKNNYTELENTFNKEQLYLISPFANPSFSLNVHILVTKDVSIVLPASIQIIEKYNNKLIYSGADFKGCSYIKNEYLETVYKYSKLIGEHLKNIEYRGICGVDYIIYNNKVYFVEINPRFQASTFLLNIALADSNFPSMQELQYKIFNNEILPDTNLLESISVPYSFYRYKKELQDNNNQYIDKLVLLENSRETYKIIYDGYDNKKYNENTFLYEVVWKHHISSCIEDDKLHLHPNIPMQYFMDNAFPLKNSKEILIKLKISLLNQGVRISNKAFAEINKLGGYNESVFNSIDLLFFEYLRINAPVDIFLTSLSPYLLDIKQQKFILYYYHIEVCEVDLELNKSFVDIKTKNGIPYKQIAFISGDRLRIKPESGCHFKKNGQGCFFCHENKSNKQKNNTYDLEDIYEVIDYCIEHEEFRHILIGGGSANPVKDDNKIIPVAEYIHSKTNKPIYLMSLPPKDANYIDKYVEAGVSEIAFNIELFDRNLAKKYMPGKGQISLEDYISKLEYGTQLLDRTGNIRTMLMVGLEKMENTILAISKLAEKGIQPMMSIFRPVPNCKLFFIIQPSNEDIYMLFIEAEKICKQHNISLGPSCASCQNNTLSITLKQE